MTEQKADAFEEEGVRLAAALDRRWMWFLRGLRRVISVPAAALAGGYVGFGALVHDFGWPLWLSVLSCIIVFANPAQVVLAGALAAGTSLATASFAVSLTGVRLLPMVVAVLPVLRFDRGPRWQELLAAHVTAITTYVEMLHRLPAIARPARMPYFLGMGLGLISASSSATAAGFLLAAYLPPVLGIGLLAISPIYFLLSLERGARASGEKAALVLGLVLAPLVFRIAPGWELLIAGLAGGTLAFFGERFLARRRGGA